jgi:aminocarboxymuconate-semialdehyde decarboxylase
MKPRPATLGFLIELVGHEQIMFGSDFPFEIGDPLGAKALPAIAKLSENVAADILYNNASKVLLGAKAG